MQVSRIPCPHCFTNLRVRDRSLIGQTIDCPDCKQPLEIVADGPKGIAIRPANRDEASPGQPKKRRRKRKPAGKQGKRKRSSKRKAETPKRSWADTFKNPVVISWIVAIAATGTFVGVVLSRASDKKADVASHVEETQPDKTKTKTGDGPNKKRPVDVWEAEQLAVNIRLLRLGGLIGDYYKQHQHFPRGTVAADGLPATARLSWIALLAADSKRYGRRKPSWKISWRDPVNEAFARQQVDLVRNPHLKATPGRDGMPVTHFVGVAGVGADGPLLPADHPRAGIFAYNRVTRRRDIKDGLGNTMLLAGVRNNVGGWAVGGPATIRPFVQEPYINGPDGFGGQHGDRMLVLMADGSVKTIAKQTAPVIVRRMAAMADGFPLDPKHPGDPLKSKVKPPPIVKKKKHPPRPPVVAVKPTRKKIDVVRINVAAALAQQVLRFENAGKATRRQLIAEVAELAGIAINIDPQLKPTASAPLDAKPVIKLKDTTAKGILTALLNETGLVYKVRPKGLVITTQ